MSTCEVKTVMNIEQLICLSFLLISPPTHPPGRKRQIRKQPHYFLPDGSFRFPLARWCEEAGRISQLWVLSLFVVPVFVKNIDSYDWESV